MGSFAFIVIAVLTSSLRGAASLKVIAGDTIDFQCKKTEFLPEFEWKNDDGSWTSLFYGEFPKPGTEQSKWGVSFDNSSSVYHYRLLKTALEDGGHYRCRTADTSHHSLNVFSPILDCGGSTPGNKFDGDLRSFRPVCRVETSGPGSAEDAPSSLKWIVGTDEVVDSTVTRNSSHVEATHSLTRDHHGKNITCVLDSGISPDSERPKCVLGPFNIAFDVKVKSTTSRHEGDCHYVDTVLTGKLSPILELVTVEDSTGIVETDVSYAEASGSSTRDVDVRLRACNLVANVVAAVRYDGVEITAVEFTPSEDPELVVGVPEDESANVVAGIAAVLVLLIGLFAGVAFFVIKRKQSSKKVDDAEMGEESGEPKAEEGKEKEANPEEEAKEEESSKGEVNEDEGKEEEEEKEEDEKKESTEDEVESVDDSDAALKAKLSTVEEAESDAALKAKLSILEDVEGMKMIDDSLNEGKEDPPLEDKDNVEV